MQKSGVGLSASRLAGDVATCVHRWGKLTCCAVLCCPQAAAVGAAEIVELLLDAGGDVAAVDVEGLTGGGNCTISSSTSGVVASMYLTCSVSWGYCACPVNQ